MAVQFENGVVLFANGSVAMDEDCCCDPPVKRKFRHCDCGPHCDGSLADVVIEVPTSYAGKVLLLSTGGCYTHAGTTSDPLTDPAPSVVSVHDSCDECCCGDDCVCVGDSSTPYPCCFENGTTVTVDYKSWGCSYSSSDCSDTVPFPTSAYRLTGTWTFNNGVWTTTDGVHRAEHPWASVPQDCSEPDWNLIDQIGETGDLGWVTVYNPANGKWFGEDGFGIGCTPGNFSDIATCEPSGVPGERYSSTSIGTISVTNNNCNPLP